MSSNEKAGNYLGDRKEAVGTTVLAEKKSVTTDAEKGNDKLADTLLSEKKSSTKDVEKGSEKLAYTLLSEKKSVTDKNKKGTDELADTLLSENKISTKKVEKGTDEKADTQLYEKKSEKKYLTNDFKKGTYKLSFKKQKVPTIFRKGLNQFEVQSTGTHGWFKLNIKFFLNNLF